MAQSIAATLSLQVAENANFSRGVFEDLWALLDSTSFAHKADKTVSIAPSAVETISLDEISTGKVLYVRANTRLEVQLSSASGSDQAILVGPDTTTGGVFFLVGEFTGLKLRNPDVATAATATVLVLGDAAS